MSDHKAAVDAAARWQREYLTKRPAERHNGRYHACCRLPEKDMPSMEARRA
jgi:hypothetical protein